MEKAYIEIDWEDRPSTATPLAEQNLDAMSRGLSTVDDRVIDLYNAQQDSPKSITVDETTGLITITKHDGQSYSYNPSTRIYNTIASNQQATQNSFAQVSRNFGDVHDLLDAMDLKVDINAETANAGLTNLQTIITQNDGYYRQEMSGISTNLNTAVSGLNDRINATNNDVTIFKSAITQTTQAIQLSVSSVSGTVDDLAGSLDENVTRLEARIDVTAGAIAMKVSRYEVIDDLAEEFGSGIEITPDRIIFASTGALVVNTTNFILTEEGNARFAGHVEMASGSIDGEDLVTAKDDGNGMHVNHSNSAWKLRSAQIDDLGTRYYTYMTKNKNLIVSDSRTGGHNADNDRTDECSVGTKNYPWRKGYFKYLRVQETKNGSSVTHDVLPEGLDVTIDPSEWVQEGNCYTATRTVNGVKGDIYLYLATKNKTNLLLCYEHRLEVDSFADNSVTFVASSLPQSSISVVLLAEDFIYASMEGADILIGFDQETNTLSATWDSPDDFSKFITWQKDTIIIEKYDPATDTWTQVYSEDSTTKDEHAFTPLVIGGST